MKNIIKKFAFLLVLASVFTFHACVDLKFDEPPNPADVVVDLDVNSNVAAIKALYDETKGYTEITDDLIIKCVVVADDASGNFYKEIIIEDETGGIPLRFNTTNLNGDFPVGKEVYVKCQGLYLGDYHGLVQLGGSLKTTIDGTDTTYSVNGIEAVLINEYIVKGKSNVPIEANTIAITDVNSSLISTLVKFENVEFADGDYNAVFADAANHFSKNRDIQDCDENTITVRTSGYADFASELTPSGNGSLIGVLSIYNDGYQLALRNTADLDMTGDRCDGSGTGGGADTVQYINEDFTAAGSSGDIVLEGWTNIANPEGSRKWIAKVYSGNNYAQASAHNDNNPTMEAWLITPYIDLSTSKKLSFKSAKAYWTHEGLSVWISTDFTGDVTTATWTELSCTLASESDANHAFIPSGDVDLSAYSGYGVIAFKYVGNESAGQTGTFRIDDVVVDDL